MSKRVESKLRYIHLSVDIRLNEDDYSYSSPSVATQIQFSVPEVMLDSDKLSKLIVAQVKALAPALEAEILQLEEERRVKEEAEKIASEVNV